MSSKVGSVESRRGSKGKGRTQNCSRKNSVEEHSEDAKRKNLKKKSSENVLSHVKEIPNEKPYNEAIRFKDETKSNKGKVSFMDVEEIERETSQSAMHTTTYKKSKESRFKTATRKLQRLLLKPFDYDANLS